MIFLSLKNDRKFAELKQTQCAYQENEESEVCGILTDRGLLMPFNMPSMPLCIIHAYEFRDWTKENIIEQFISVMMDDDFIENWRLEEDDDF